ncbi:MAG TPA: protein phosphatase 2C domain-containing protein [Promineifilum sp.]|nr:protein phosphatase 2C domain-containing protein [Promineifilum sp.]
MAETISLSAAWRTDTGLVRGHNEDFVKVYEPATEDERRRHGAVYIVADGVGGADAGEVASQYASERTLHHYLAADGRTDWGQRLIDAMQAANTDLRRLAAGRDDSRRMATTMVAVVIQDGQAFIGNVGDSRAYQWRKGRLEQISRDQSLVARLVEEGALTPEEAVHYPYKNVILYSIGSEKRPPIDLYPIVLEPGDLLVLCSDGLTRHVEDGEIAAIAGDERPDVAADILVRLARERGGEDNITVAIIQHGERLEESTQPTARLTAAQPVVDAPAASIPVPVVAPPPVPQGGGPPRERPRSLWPLTFALVAIMAVLIFVLWVVVQRATTI